MNENKDLKKVLLKLEEQVERDMLKESDLLHVALETWENVHQTSHAWHTSPGELLKMAAVGLFGAAIANTDLKKVWGKVVDYSSEKAKQLLNAAKIINQSSSSDSAEQSLENYGLQLVPITESYRKRKLKEAREPNTTTVMAMKKMMAILQKNIQGAGTGEFNLDEIKAGLKELQSELGTEKQIQSVHSKYEKEISKITQAKQKAAQKAQPVEEGPKDNISPLDKKKDEENKKIVSKPKPASVPTGKTNAVPVNQVNKVEVNKK